MSRQTVLLIFGGESSEHDVSIVSARNVYAAMDNTKYDVQLCYIDKIGKWWLLDAWKENPQAHAGVQLAAVPGARSFVTIPGDKIIHPAVIFAVVHGHGGEDGVIQGLADTMHIPIVGSDTIASAVCWDKVITKQMLESYGIKTAPYKVHHLGEPVPNYEELLSQLGSPLFVKPARSGSSIGVSKVESAEELNAAVTLAHEHSNAILIEQALLGRELEVSVLGNPPHHKVSKVGQIIPGEEFYTYDDKYAADSNAAVVLNPDLNPDFEERVRSIAHRAYEVLGCRGLARIDFLTDKDDNIYVNEFNTMPGFTNISMYPKLWHEAGVKYPELIDDLIKLAFE